MPPMSPQPRYRLGPLPTLIFASRWLQLPLYLGLIVAQGVYVWQFGVELVHLVSEVFLHGGEAEQAEQTKCSAVGHETLLLK